MSIPYTEEIEQEIDFSIVQKSRAFQKMVRLGGFKITHIGEHRLEKNLKHLSDAFVENEKQNVEIASGPHTEVVIRGHFYDSTGYAKVNRNLAFCLHRHKCVTAIDPVNNQNTLNEVETKVLSLLRRPLGSDAILIDSVVPSQAKRDKKGYSILYTTAEANRVPKHFIDVANTYNELWVTSDFCKSAFLNSGYDKEISIVHPIINCNLYKRTSSTMQFRPKIDSFKFLSVQTFGYRKGTDALIRSFCKAFTKKDDVSLVILIAEKSIKQQKKIKKQFDDIISEYVDSPNICMTFKSVPEYLMPSFYSSFDAFVLTSRGEGFGLPLCEASLCDLPVLSVNYGGPRDFLNHDNSYLVEIDELENATEGSTNVYYWDSQQFPKLGDSFTDNFASAFRDFYANFSAQKEKNNKLKSFIQTKFQGDIVGSWAKNKLDMIYKNAGATH